MKRNDNMPIYKRCSRCMKRLPINSTCECLKKRHKVYDRYFRDKKSSDFYQSKEWELTRLKVLTLDKGIDVYIYMTTGDIVSADAVHHIDPLKDNWARRCDTDNLISLSNETHSMIERMYSKDKREIMTKLYALVSKYREQLSA